MLRALQDHMLWNICISYQCQFSIYKTFNSIRFFYFFWQRLHNLGFFLFLFYFWVALSSRKPVRLAKHSMIISAERHMIAIKTKNAFEATQSSSHWVRSSNKLHHVTVKLKEKWNISTKLPIFPEKWQKTCSLSARTFVKPKCFRKKYWNGNMYSIPRSRHDQGF